MSTQHRDREDLQTKLERVEQRSRRDRKAVFNNLGHPILEHGGGWTVFGKGLGDTVSRVSNYGDLPDGHQVLGVINCVAK